MSATKEHENVETAPDTELECPKCGGAIAERDEGCPACGLIYSIWEARQQGRATDPPSEAKPPDKDQERGSRKHRSGDFGPWTKRGGRFAAYLLFGGFALPLLKHTVLMDSSVWVWPWTLLGSGLSDEVLFATATLSSGQHMAVWTFTPLICGALALLLSHMLPLLFRASAMTVLGTVSLLTMLVGLHQESEIYGLNFVPPSAAGGWMVFFGLLVMTAVAGANHLRKLVPTGKPLRIMSGIASGLLAGIFVICLLGGPNAWGNWTIKLLSLVVLVYCGLNIRNAFRKTGDESQQELISRVGRGILFATPAVCLFAQAATKDPFTTYVVGGGGGFINVFFSILKSSCVFMGGALLLAYGSTATLGLVLSRKPKRRRVPRKRKRVRK